MMTFYVAGSTDEQKAQFVQTMRHGTMKEQNMAAEAAAETALKQM